MLFLLNPKNMDSPHTCIQVSARSADLSELIMSFTSRPTDAPINRYSFIRCVIGVLLLSLPPAAAAAAFLAVAVVDVVVAAASVLAATAVFIDVVDVGVIIRRTSNFGSMRMKLPNRAYLHKPVRQLCCRNFCSLINTIRQLCVHCISLSVCPVALDDNDDDVRSNFGSATCLRSGTLFGLSLHLQY